VSFFDCPSDGFSTAVLIYNSHRAHRYCHRVERLQRESFLTDMDKMDEIKSFESNCNNIRHFHCRCCRSIGLNIQLNADGVCKGKCSKLKDVNYYLDRHCLPVWYNDEGVAVFSVPKCLKDLSSAEKLLIQRVSPFVPLHHIKHGVFGLSGHVCAFEQDIGGFVNTLPRRANDVTLLKVLKKVKSEVCGSDESSTIAYRVRRSKVFQALAFLKKYNPEYKDINIDMSALDWMEGEEDELSCQVLETDEIVTCVDLDRNIDDAGPASGQCLDPKLSCEDVGEFGFIDVGEKSPVCSRDEEISKELLESISKSANKDQITVDWPAISSDAVSEYGDKRIFVNAFPWLFPGGIGDIKDFPSKNLSDWGKMMLYYEDGRFASDKIFGFFAMNYIIRNRNSSSGSWFINNFQKDCPNNLEELKEDIEAGNTSFVNSLTYYSQRIKGSSSYWFKKRMELYSWINHHIELGNGPPTYFITLSCAEFLWPDVIRLVKERMDLAGEDSSKCFVGSDQLGKYVNQYSIVVQEFFQQRVILWLNTVGKNVFDIKHYWVRYEFAPGRGQIHAHLLAIPDNHKIYELCHMDLKQKNGFFLRAQRLSAWASEKFGLTASVADPVEFDSLNINNQNSPCRIRFSEVSKEMVESDFEQLMNHVQVHDCSGFCLREIEGKKNRVCKAGCGQERNAGGADTPGFPLCEKAEIKFDHRRSQKLYMPRNHGRINQTSATLLQSWRGNCDIQLLVYNSDPRNPDIEEIAKVTDYIVSYSTKGNTTLKEEREQTSKIILA